jgi:hypothetical protein
MIIEEETSPCDDPCGGDGVWELPGQRMRRIILQDAEKGTGNAGRQACGRRGPAIVIYLEAYTIRIRMHSVPDYVVPDMFNLGKAA